MDSIYKSLDPDVVAPKLEEMVRADLAWPEPLVYRIVDTGAPVLTGARSVLADMSLNAFGGRTTSIFAVEFELPGPRKAWLTAFVNRHTRTWSYLGTMRYALEIGRPVKNEVVFEKANALGRPKFVGGEEAAKLNAVPDLARRVNKVLVEKIVISGLVTATPVFRLAPTPEGTAMFLATLPDRKTSWTMRTNSTSNAGEILRIAADIEAALG
jgi:hypothetical protein